MNLTDHMIDNPEQEEAAKALFDELASVVVRHNLRRGACLYAIANLAANVLLARAKEGESLSPKAQQETLFDLCEVIDNMLSTGRPN